jgi:phage repressor protein C with HTH and peptisase S24 domain
VNNHERGDYLEQLCRKWLLKRIGGSRIIETKLNSIHGIDFAILMPDGSVAIIEVKSKTGTAVDPQMTVQWIKDRLNAELAELVREAFRNNKKVWSAIYSVDDSKADNPLFKVKGTGTYQWSDFFEGLVPKKENFTMLGRSAKITGDTVTIYHTLECGDIRQVHEYEIRLKSISSLVLKTIIEHGNFPFDIPHSHRVIENGKETHCRAISEWHTHEAGSDHLRSDKVTRNTCTGCRSDFFCFSSREHCHVCGDISKNEALDTAQLLIIRAQSLSGSTDWKETGLKMKELMSQWQKECRDLPREQSDLLWNRFQSARQIFYDGQKRHFNELDRKRQEGKKNAERLIARAESLAGSTDWKSTGEEMKRLMTEWKAKCRPLPRDQADNLWNRFQSARQKFYDRRTAYFDAQEKERQANKRHAESLIARAQALSGSTDWKSTGEEMKRLMTDWKANCRPLPRESADSLWDRFQSARQKFYDRRTAYFDAQEKERQANKRHAESLIARAQALSGSTDWKSTGEEMKRLMTDWKANCRPLPRESADSLWDRFQSARQKFYDRRNDHFDAVNRERQDNLREKERLIDRMEGLIYSSDKRSARAEAKDLQSEWKRIGPIPREENDRVWSRFRNAADQVFNSR